jgi:hypothetical protein
MQTLRQSSTKGASSVLRRTRRNPWVLLSLSMTGIVLVCGGPSSTVFGFVVSPSRPLQQSRGVSLSTTRRFLAPQPPVQQDETKHATTSKRVSNAVLKEPGSLFDPFDLPRSMDQLEIATQITNTAKTADSDQQELGIWAARGLLLLVAAIWGTNFAVRVPTGMCVSAVCCRSRHFAHLHTYLFVAHRV